MSLTLNNTKKMTILLCSALHPVFRAYRRTDRTAGNKGNERNASHMGNILKKKTWFTGSGIGPLETVKKVKNIYISVSRNW